MRYILFLFLGLFAVAISLKPELVSWYSYGLITFDNIKVTKYIVWSLLTVNWLYIWWCNKKKQDLYKGMIDSLGKDKTE